MTTAATDRLRESDTPAGAAPHSRRRYAFLFVTLVVPFMTFTLMQSAVAPALRTIQLHLHASTEAGAWILTAYLISASVSAPILGRLGDMFGKKRLLVVSLAVFCIGCLLAALATSITILIAARLVQGIAGALFPLSVGILRDEAPPGRMVKDIALLSSLTGVGGGIGVVLAGPITEHLGFSYLFWLPCVMVGLALPAAVVAIPESRSRVPGRIDMAGAVLLSAWLVALLLGVTEGRTWGWTSAAVLGLFAGAAVGLVLWIAFELRQREPLVDMVTMRLRGVWTVNAVTFVLGFGMFASWILLPQLVEVPRAAGGLGATVTGAGVFMAPSTFASFLVGPLAGRLAATVGAAVPFAAGILLAALSFFDLAFAHDQAWQIYAGSTVLGAGCGLSFSSLGNLMVASVRADQTGVAVGMNAIVRTIGGAVGAQATASVLAASVVAGTVALHGFAVGFTIGGAVLIAGFAGCFALPRAPRSPSGRSG